MIFVITLDILEYKDESTKLYRLNDCDIVVIIRLSGYTGSGYCCQQKRSADGTIEGRISC